MVGRAISGRSVGQALVQAAEQVRMQQMECQQSLRQLDASCDELVDRRGQALLELAEHYFPEVTRESVLSAFRGIRDQLLDVLKRKQRRERQLHEALQQDEAEAIRIKSSLEQLAEQLTVKATERQQLEQQVAQQLKAHERFQQLSQQALAAEQELTRNEERIAEIQQEANEKLPAYDDNRLFRYLYDRGFGTSAYKKKGLTRQLDQWIAKLVKFPRAKRSYDFLRVTPELMATEVGRKRDQFNVLMEQLEAIETEIADRLGLTRVLQEGEALSAQRDVLVTELADLEQTFQQHHQQLQSMEGTQNEFYEQGVAQMKAFLADMQHSWLQHQSRSTPERQDDELVAEIGWLNEQLDKARGDSSALMQEQHSWEERAEGLQDVLTRFRRAGFDSRKSMFAEAFNVQRQIGGFVRGEIGREQLWSEMRRHQEFYQPRRETDRGWHIDDSWDMDDLGGVLGRVLIEVAGEAMKHAVRRGMQRRGPFRF